MKKKKWKFLLIVLVTALLFLGAGFLWWSWATQPVSRQEQASSEIFVIQKGEDLSSIADRLQNQNLVKSSLAFRTAILVKGLAGKVQAGDFRLRSSMTTEEVAYILTHGTLDIWLTFPEGWRREEFGRRLAANLQDFDNQEFLDLTETNEGYLFPDTYLVPQEASPPAVVEIFLKNFEEKFNRDLQDSAAKFGLTEKQVVIFASMVEREARYEKDRPLIAGILLKRWQNDWPLQVDATIQYALGSTRCTVKSEKCDYWQTAGKTDLEIDSPYNTYKYKGLPPTPICNPGLASIKAVVYPQKSDYWFYLSDPSGAVHYSETNEEHNENIKKHLRNN